jgi:uncharacterized protein (DUF2141 family)
VKRSLLILAGFILISNYAFSQYILRIGITDLRNNTGKIMLQVFDVKENLIEQQMGDIKGKNSSFEIKNLPAGKYAVRFYHDENLNQVMETNLVGKPTEGYGFSNNVTGRFGMPPFEKWLFDLNGDKEITIKAVY